MHKVIQCLVEEHEKIGDVLLALDVALDQYRPGESPDYGLLFQALSFMRTFPDVCHYPKEEIILNATLSRDETSGALIERLLREHQEIAKLTTDLHEVLKSAVLGNLSGRTNLPKFRSYTSLMRRHIACENRVAFPLASRILGAAELDDMAGHFSEMRFAHFDSGATTEFDELHDKIMRGASQAARAHNPTGPPATGTSAHV